MILNNGWRKFLNISVIIGILSGLGLLGRWYMVYAQNSAVTTETLKTHTKEIDELKDNQKQMYLMMRTMFVIDSLERAGDTKFMGKVYAITNNKDTVPETLNTNEYSTDNLPKDSLE